MSPISVYLHIPYCQAKCPYCDFNSYAASSWPEQAYVRALCTELQTYTQHPSFQGASVGTIFFGGGTPSLFAAASIGALLEQIARLWTVANDVEITLEANPGTVNAPHLQGLRAAGANRLSFGVQSFQPHHLARLGRIHSADEARAAVRHARQAGFDNVNIDLIYALPEQSLDEWSRDLESALELETEHVSAYNLTYEEGTAFHQWRAQGKLASLPEELEEAMFHLTHARLVDAGLQQYEISNYARPQHQCRHNLTYWRSQPYVGVGAGAHGYALSVGSAHHGERWANEKQPGRYLTQVAAAGHARVSTEYLEARQARGEFVFLGLRCHEGVADAMFESRFGQRLETAFPQIAEFEHDGLLVHARGSWALTRRGLLLADSVFATFL